MVKLKQNSPFFSAGADLLSRKYFEVDDIFLHIEIVAPLLRVNMPVLTFFQPNQGYRTVSGLSNSSMKAPYAIILWANFPGQLSMAKFPKQIPKTTLNLIFQIWFNSV